MLLNNGSKSEMISPTHDVFCGKLTFLRRKMFKCKECDFRSASRQSWQIHQSAHIEIQPFWFDEYDYIPILKMRFRPLESTKFQARLFKCKYCKFQTQWEGIFNFHTSQHSNFKPRKCQDCKFSTAAKNLLNFHRNIYYFKDSVECNTSDTKYVNVSSTGEQSTFQCCKLISNSPGIALRKCFVKIERMSYFVNRKNIPNKDSNDFNFGETQNVHAKYRDKSQLHVTNEQSNYHQVDH